MRRYLKPDTGIFPSYFRHSIWVIPMEMLLNKTQPSIALSVFRVFLRSCPSFTCSRLQRSSNSFPAVTARLRDCFRPETVTKLAETLFHLTEHGFGLESMGISSDDVLCSHGQIRTDQNSLCFFVFHKDKLQRLVQFLAPQVCPRKKPVLSFSCRNICRWAS